MIVNYLNNPMLKAAGVPINYTGEQIREYAKCAQDPVYFLENYGKVVSLDRGVVPFKLFPYQKRMIEAIHNNSNIIGKLFRQAGKSTIIAGYVAWYVLFNEQKTAAILANKGAIAKEIFSRVQFFIENVPMWLQQGIVEWNKTSFKLENGSRCFSASSSPSAIRGTSINFLLCDEFAHMLPNLAEEFIASVFPTVSSAKTSKLVLISTPNGMNHYYKMWKEAEEGKNGFVPVEGKWQEHPDRDDAWAAKMLAQLGEIKYNQEVLCSFIGSSYTLIDGNKLATFPIIEHKTEISGVKIFEQPQANRNYVITVDTSRGQHLDYSAFVVFDATTMPYKVVATFKNNRIPSSEYPFLIYRMAQYYKDAYVLVEVNDIGGEVANILWYEYEYEHVYFTGKTKAESQAITEGKGYPGIRTTKSVKTKGTATLKDLIEKDQLFFTSFEIIQELSVFVKKRASYAADDELINDDLTTCLWLFAWLSKQPIFSEINNTNTRQTLLQNRAKEIENSLVPFGFVSTTEEIKQPSGLRPDESIMDWFGRAGVTELPVGMTIDEWIMGE